MSEGLTLGTQMKQDLDALLHKHPGPWRINGSGHTYSRALDALSVEVVEFEDYDLPFYAGIVAAVNFYHCVTSPTPIRISQPADAVLQPEDHGGGA